MTKTGIKIDSTKLQKNKRLILTQTSSLQLLQVRQMFQQNVIFL